MAVRRAPIVLGCALLALATGCPPQSSRPCSTDDECPGARCLRGACAPQCFRDGECAAGQVCSEGSCVARPQCAVDADCASGFVCRTGACVCTGDAACARDEACLSGQCKPKPLCASDADCASLGRRCDPLQGVCVPPCTLAEDCAPGLDPVLAGVLYQCSAGSCLQRCLNDQGCGAGFTCLSNVCVRATCRTFSECPSGQYCTSATQGRCVPYQTCTASPECAANFTCRPFSTTACPPGFPCAMPICQELSTCLIDADCPLAPPSFCQDRHCQPSSACSATVPCPAGHVCVASACFPGGCRGPADCTAPQACVGGQCVDPPASAEIRAVSLSPKSAVLAVGGTLQLRLVAYRSDGSSFPLASADFSVLDDPTAATVDATGLVTARASGQVRVRGGIAVSPAATDEASITLHAAVATGRRVVVIEESSRQPLAGVQVLGCHEPCSTPELAVTDSQGEARFSFTGPTASFSAASPVLRSDGLPRYDRASVVATSATDLLLPLTDNPVHGAAGFNAVLSFQNVHTTGAFWLGFAALSAGNPVDSDLSVLLGEPFDITFPGTTQRVAVPGTLVAYTTVGLGLPVPLKQRAYGLGQAGRRTAAGFAGRLDLQQLGVVSSLDFLAYAGGMDYALQPFVNVPHLPDVVDSTDLDNDGLCGSASQCPAGSEDLPDYQRFPALSLAPAREQLRRTEVVVPNLPVGLDTAVLSTVEVTAEAGLIQTGFSSRAAGLPAPDGTRPVPNGILRSGSPYGGVEIGQPGVWIQAVAQGAGGFGTAGGSTSARLTRGPSLPTRVVIAPFLPLPAGSSYSAATRTLSPGQPEWNAVASAGATLGRLVLDGSDSRHVVYFSIDSSQTAVHVPASPPGADSDAADQASTFALEALQLSTGLTPEDALDLPGANLTQLPVVLDGYSRFRP